MNVFQRVRAILGIALLFGTSPAWADAADGLANFQIGRFSEAVEAWRIAAVGGDAASALYLGVMYDTGFGVPQTPAEALAWYQRAAAGGSRTAMLNTALMFDAGRGTPSDAATAAVWYARAARAGSGRGAFNLGLLYESGIGVQADREHAKTFYSMAMLDGVAEAQTRLRRLGDHRGSAIGHAQPDLAMVAFERAQRVLLTRGPTGDAEAADLFRKAASAGNALAAYNLGYCYEHGLGVAVDVDQALTWYHKSAALTNDPALRAIAQSGAQNILTLEAHVQR